MRSRSQCLSLVISAALLAAGCADWVVDQSLEPEGPGIGDLVDGIADGKRDGSGFPVQSATLGEAFGDQAVEAMPPGVTVETADLSRHMTVYRFQVEAGQTFAAIMRSQTADLDGYLLLKDPDYVSVREAQDQVLLPQTWATDAVIVHTAATAGTHYLFAAGQDFASGGSFRLDLLALDEAPGADLMVSNPALRAISGALRDDEALLHPLVASDALTDGDDGLLVESDGFGELALVDKARARQVAHRINQRRTRLFQELAWATWDSPEPEAVARLGRICGAIWRALR